MIFLLLFLIYIVFLCHPSDVKSCESLSTLFFTGSSRLHVKNDPEYLTRMTAQVFISLMKLSDEEFGFEKFSRSSEAIFSHFFFPFRLFDGIHFQDNQILVIFFSPSILVLPWFDTSFLSVICRFPLLICMVHFSRLNSITTSCLNIFISCIKVFFISWLIVHVHKVIYVFLQFCKFVVLMTLLKNVIV